MTITHDEFCKALENARPAERAVYQWMKWCGFEVRLPPKKVAPNKETRWDYVDDGDIELCLDGKLYRVEVKNPPSMDFNSIETIPYGLFIIDEAYKFEGEGSLPLYAYVMVNQALDKAIVVGRSALETCVKENLFDTRCQEYKDFYRCRRDEKTLKIYNIGERQ